MTEPTFMELLRKQEYLTSPGTYGCRVCQKQKRGGVHVLPGKGAEIVWVCPDCWPAFLNKLEKTIRQMEVKHEGNG